jgi:hypothetical protein
MVAELAGKVLRLKERVAALDRDLERRFSASLAAPPCHRVCVLVCRRALVFRMPGLKRPEGTRRRRLERILKPLTRAY